MADIDALRAAEERLQAAQLASDVDALDALLHPDLVFVTPDGVVHDKGDDLDSHRTGAMRVDTLDPEDLIVRISDGVGVTIFTARMAGEFAGGAFESRMRYTRTWADTADGWRLVAAHIMALPDDPA